MNMPVAFRRIARRTARRTVLSLLIIIASSLPSVAQVAAVNAQEAAGNKPERLAWFSRLGFGLFIHWSVDSQLGSVISHSLVGADPSYRKYFFEELPKTFNPRRFDPVEWADLAKLAGFKYVVFTAKHHSGFCMFDTRTTTFDIEHTPYQRDITAELIKAFRSRGIAIGLYFSPDDFWFLDTIKVPISRRRVGVTPQEEPRLMAHDLAQIRELLTRYGKIDIFFIDGPADKLRELCWKLQPDIVVTRGAMTTPEQYIPGVPIPGPWEANMTMGTQWQYKPTHESYKSGPEVIERLIETRAKGGNFLLNIGPRPDGVIPIAQEERLREVALWNAINGEAIYGVTSWIITNEENIWFTKKRDADTVYAIVTRPAWKRGTRREFTIQSVKAGPATTVRILGQTGEILEYQTRVDPRARWTQKPDGLHISAMRAQRVHNDSKWPNPVTLKITDARPALDPPIIVTGSARSRAGGVMLSGELKKVGAGGTAVAVGFQIRERHDNTQPLATAAPWRDATRVSRSAPGAFSLAVENLVPGRAYDYRAVVWHPRITLSGDRKSFTAR